MNSVVQVANVSLLEAVAMEDLNAKTEVMNLVVKVQSVILLFFIYSRLKPIYSSVQGLKVMVRF